VTARYPLSAHPAAVAVGPQVWVTDFRQGTLWRIDQRTGAISSIPAIGNPRAVTILGGRVYVASDGPSLLAARWRFTTRRAERRRRRLELSGYDGIDVLAAEVCMPSSRQVARARSSRSWARGRSPARLRASSICA
jgi:sugar lactone lactonase YvrE